MARRKTVEEKNYDELIKASEDRIKTLTSDLKEEKVNLKNLKKEKVRYDEMIIKRKRDEEIQEATKLFIESGKTLEELKALLG